MRLPVYDGPVDLGVATRALHGLGGGLALITTVLLAPVAASAEPTPGGTDELSLGVEPCPLAGAFPQQSLAAADEDSFYWVGPGLRGEWRRRITPRVFSVRMGATVTVFDGSSWSPVAYYHSPLFVLLSATALAETALPLASGRFELAVGAGGGLSMHFADVDSHGFSCTSGCVRPGFNAFAGFRTTYWATGRDGIDITTRTGFAYSALFVEIHVIDLGISWRHAL